MGMTLGDMYMAEVSWMRNEMVMGWEAFVVIYSCVYFWSLGIIRA